MTVLWVLERVPMPFPRLLLSRLRCLVFFFSPVICPTSYSPMCLVVAFLGFCEGSFRFLDLWMVKTEAKEYCTLQTTLVPQRRKQSPLCSMPGYCPTHGPIPHISRPALALTCSFLLQPNQTGPWKAQKPKECEKIYTPSLNTRDTSS